jgi:hypothetical protein
VLFKSAATVAGEEDEDREAANASRTHVTAQQAWTSGHQYHSHQKHYHHEGFHPSSHLDLSSEHANDNTDDAEQQQDIRLCHNAGAHLGTHGKTHLEIQHIEEEHEHVRHEDMNISLREGGQEQKKTDLGLTPLKKYNFLSPIKIPSPASRNTQSHSHSLEHSRSHSHQRSNTDDGNLTNLQVLSPPATVAADLNSTSVQTYEVRGVGVSTHTPDHRRSQSTLVGSTEDLYRDPFQNL